MTYNFEKKDPGLALDPSHFVLAFCFRLCKHAGNPNCLCAEFLRIVMP